MFFMASDAFTLPSTSLSRSVTGLGVEGRGSCPEISRSAVVSAASDGAGEAAAGADELAESPPAPVPDCPQTGTMPTDRNRTSGTTDRIFIQRIIGLLPTPCNIYFQFHIQNRNRRCPQSVGRKATRLPKLLSIGGGSRRAGNSEHPSDQVFEAARPCGWNRIAMSANDGSSLRKTLGSFAVIGLERTRWIDIGGGGQDRTADLGVMNP